MAHQRGQSAVEYAILIGLVCVVCVSGITTLGTSIYTAMKSYRLADDTSMMTLGIRTNHLTNARRVNHE